LLERCNSPSAASACATHYQRFIFDAYPDMPDLVEAAERRVETLGGSNLQIGGGRAFQFIARAFGWKLAKHCRRAWRGAATAAADVRVAAPPADRGTAEKLPFRG
jgi:hypothetical protein